MKNVIITSLIIFGTSFTCNSQSGDYQVYAIKYAGPIVRPYSFLVQDGPEENMNLIFLVWLIKGNGKNILVDAGFLRDLREYESFGVTNYVRPDSMLFELNLKAEDITDVILTHPHWDHADGVDLFPNAQVWIQKEDYEYCVVDAWQKGGKKEYNKRDVKKLLELNLAGKLNLIDGDEKEIIPGVHVYTGSRHTYNSQYVLVESGQDKIIIASDNMYTYYNLDHLKSAPSGATYSTEGYVNALKRMKTLASENRLIIPGHDGLMFDRFPEVAKDIIQIK